MNNAWGMQLTNLTIMLLYIPVLFYLIPQYHRQHLTLEHTQQIHFPYCKVQFIKKFIHHSHSALDAGLAGTRTQSCDRYGSSTLQLWQDLGVVFHFPSENVHNSFFLAFSLVVSFIVLEP